MDTSSQLVAVAVSRMRERESSDPAPANACNSSTARAVRRAPCSCFCLLFSPRPRATTVSNMAIGERFVIIEAAVRRHVGAIFSKLELRSGDDALRRILAVLV
jgi:hypothetical protein